MLKEFKALADKANISIDDIKDDYITLCHSLGIEIATYSDQVVTNKLGDLIKELLTPDERGEKISRRSLMDVQAELVYESVLDNVDNSIYLTLFKMVSGHQQYKPLTDEVAWVNALSKAKDLRTFAPNLYRVDHTKLHEEFAKRWDIAHAAKELKTMGCEISYNGTEIICNSGLREVVKDLESKIITYGAGFLIGAIFDTLKINNSYFPIFRRYLIQNPIGFISSQAKPLLPYGYLLNLSVKHLDKQATVLKEKDRVKLLEEIYHIAKLIAKIADARHYSTWEIHHQNKDTLLDNIRIYTLFDTIYAFPCANISVVIGYLENLFSWVDSDLFEGKYGFTINEMIEVTKCIDKMYADTYPQIIYASAINKALNYIGKDKILKILDQMSHKVGTINQDFFFTEDYDKVNFGFKPLVAISGTKFVLCDKSWCAAGFYETLATLIREFDQTPNKSNTEIGNALEAYIHKRLSEKGVSFSYGRYAEGATQEGEADVIITSDKTITLIEIKKKVLTRRARSGSVIGTVIDLAGSLLDAQIQTGRTEILLRENGYVDLAGEYGYTRINWNKRDIERIALTQWDFGSLQDRGVINNILSILTGVELNLTCKFWCMLTHRSESC